MRKIIAVAVIGPLALIAAFWLLHATSRLIVDRILPCPMPCRWDREKGYSNCAPVEAHLKIKTTPEPRGHDQAVWYRASVKNNTCETVRLNSDFFTYNQDYKPAIDAGMNERIMIRDAAGRPLLPDRVTPSDSGIDAGEDEIHPYQPDNSAVLAYTAAERDKSNPYYLFESIALEPGQTLIASPSLLKPYRLVYQTVDTGKYIGTMRGPESVDMKDAAQRYALPPAGFRKLKEYSLHRSGTYSAQFAINDLALIWYPKVRGPAYRQKLVRALYYLAGPPGPDDSWGARINVKSEKIDFTVPK